MEKSGLAWSVEQAQLMTCNGISVDTHKALFRSDTNKILGIVGTGYTPVQNPTAFAFFDVITEKYGATYEYAGIIKDGRKIFLQAKLGRSFEAAPGDQVDMYLTMVTAHDGSLSLRAFLTPIRLFCQNQLIRAIRHATTNIQLKHTSTVNNRLRDATMVFQVSMQAAEEFEAKAKFLTQKLVDRQMVEKFLNEISWIPAAPDSGTSRTAIEALFHNGRGNRGQNAWELYNAAVEYVDHERSKDPEKALDSAMFGAGALLKERAFQAALAV